jgi:hypothetical protein
MIAMIPPESSPLSNFRGALSQMGDEVGSPWQIAELDTINSALSTELDVTQAKKLFINANSQACFQGQTHGHDGFLLSPEDASDMIRKAKANSDVIFPYLIGEELLSGRPARPMRYIIDFSPRNVLESHQYPIPLQRIKELVLPKREKAAEIEKQTNLEVRRNKPNARINRHHQGFLAQWWLLSYTRSELLRRIREVNRYIVCVRTTKRPIFEFIDSSIRPNDALQVFPLADDYSFGVLQSDLHWKWFVERCSTLKRDFRYTSDTVFDSFPFPQNPSLENITKVAKAAVDLRQLRLRIMRDNSWSRRDLYRTLDLPGENPLRKAHFELDIAVRDAYGMIKSEESLEFILELNHQVASREAEGLMVVSPGLPSFVANPAEFITSDCVGHNPLTV